MISSFHANSRDRGRRPFLSGNICLALSSFLFLRFCSAAVNWTISWAFMIVCSSPLSLFRSSFVTTSLLFLLYIIPSRTAPTIYFRAVTMYRVSLSWDRRVRNITPVCWLGPTSHFIFLSLSLFVVSLSLLCFLFSLHLVYADVYLPVSSFKQRFCRRKFTQERYVDGIK